MVIPILILATCVQIIVESFPISSSGHVLLTFLYGAPEAHFSSDLHNFSHIPTLFIVAMIFRHEWVPLFLNFFRVIYKKARGRIIKIHEQSIWELCFLITGFVVTTSLVTLGLEQLTKTYKHEMAHSPSLLFFGFCITMLLLFSLYFKKPSKKGYKEVNLKIALALGLVQGFALIPGLSRFASTFVAGKWLGLSPRRSLHYTVLLETAIIFGAIGRAFIDGIQLTPTEITMLSMPISWLCFAGATYLGYQAFIITHRWAITYNFWLFGFYMILPVFFTAHLAFGKGNHLMVHHQTGEQHKGTEHHNGKEIITETKH